MTQEQVKIIGVVVVGVLAAIMLLFEIADNLRREREKDRAREAELEAQGLDPQSWKGDPLLARVRSLRGLTLRGAWRWGKDWLQEHSEKPASPQGKR